MKCILCDLELQNDNKSLQHLKEEYLSIQIEQEPSKNDNCHLSIEEKFAFKVAEKTEIKNKELQRQKLDLNSSSRHQLLCYHCSLRFKTSSQLCRHLYEEHLLQCIKSTETHIANKLMSPEDETTGNHSVEASYGKHKILWGTKNLLKTPARGEHRVSKKIKVKNFSFKQASTSNEEHPKNSQRQSLCMSLFKCTNCDSWFRTISEQKNHTCLPTQRPSPLHLFKCHYCSLWFKAKLELLNHLNEEHMQERCNLIQTYSIVMKTLRKTNKGRASRTKYLEN